MRVVIVGAGQAGAWVARTVRENAAEAQITLIGEEVHEPYERPPLSKGVMSGAESSPPCVLSAMQAQELNIDMRLGITVTSIDRVEKRVRLSTGEEASYDKLVLATGGSARRPNIPGIDLPGVHTLRTLDDAVRLRTDMQTGKSLLVLGGGWIGLEVAATARQLGMSVTLIEGGSRLCARSVPPDVSDFLLARHLREGVNVHLNGALTAIRNDTDGRLRAVTHYGEQSFDAIVVGIGLDPNTALAKGCGLEVSNGVLVDILGRSSDLNIYATGDVANQPCTWNGGDPGSRIRLESWANAQNQGIAVGRALTGYKANYSQDIPWFWSDQYDLNLQVLGIPTSGGKNVWRGSPESGKFCIFQLVDERIQSVIAVNMARELKIAKRWIKSGICPLASQLSHLEFKLDKFKGLEHAL